METLGHNAPENVQRHGRATVHSLRHTFASWLLQNGAGLAEVQDMLGHSDLQMTRRYAHLENATVAARMAEKLDGIVGAPQAQSQNRQKRASCRSQETPKRLKRR